MKQTKKFFTVRKKLIAAVASLALALIMVVSSTYAWFTLSTAPEVTGINTQIGANGNLEMALYTGGSVQSGMVNATDPATTTNLYWGNLIDLSDPSYGLGNIALKPSRLNVNGGKVVGYYQGSMLFSPVYNNYGQVTGLNDNTLSALYDATKGAFTVATGNVNGVRGIGVSTDRSAQETAYINALATIVSETASAKNTAQSAVATYGSTLANIAVKHALMEDAGGYTADDVAALKAFATELQKSITAIQNIVKNAEIAYLCSQTYEDDGEGVAEPKTAAEKFAVDKAAIEGATATILSVDNVPTVAGCTHSGVDAAVLTAIDQDAAKLDTAITTLNSLSGTVGWSAISTPFSDLLNADMIVIAGYTIDQIKDGIGTSDQEGYKSSTDVMNAIFESFTTNGSINITVKSTAAKSAGVMADIADFVGTYSADIRIPEITYSGVTLKNVKASLTAEQYVATIHAKTVAAKAAGYTPKANAGVTTDARLNDLYGFALDFAFRTNASGSYLMLQTNGTQRIYGESSNTATQGNGSYLEFSYTATMNAEKVANLMSSIRIVFTDKEGNILAIGATDQTVIAEDIEPEEEGGEVVKKNVGPAGEGISYEVSGNKVKAYIELYTPSIEDNGSIKLTKITGDTAAQLMSLQQNELTRVSAIVYLDGDKVDNTAVDAFASIGGSMNLQFSSDADLKPMDYTDLQ